MIVGVVFAPLSLFFTYYTVRLLYLNLMMEDAASHRTGGMLIGSLPLGFSSGTARASITHTLHVPLPR